jgi:hypothetical protein
VADLQSLIVPEPFLFMDNSVVEGVVISDQEYGNYKSDELFLQCETGALSIVLSEDLRVKRGSRIRVSVFGGVLRSREGTAEVKGLFPQQIEVLEENVLPSPHRIALSELDKEVHSGKWLQLYPVQVNAPDHVLTSGSMVKDCYKGLLLMIHEGSDLSGMVPGEGSGSVSGFVWGNYFYPGRRSDINLAEGPLQCMPADEDGGVFISELADPENSTTELNVRFIELYNPSAGTVDLSGWELRRYTNGNESYTASTVIKFDDQYIPANATFVIAANTEAFEKVYGFAPDMEGGGSTAADSNGDDNIVLTGPSGEVKDIFGVPGEDGTGTGHDFQDGRAVKKTEIEVGSTILIPEQWEVYNGHGKEGSQSRLHYAPGDFDPGYHK